ncbi:hypothetical protein BpHYR1_010170 [Brachionus plicatilis]|uniref:Uncharacterized protein n=1 Tax=Brachionus plicatilis TaxID=10195 RepID=A0A3M7R4Q4_BRAPC|nr:hypothetical protein BpHYR1_010170 [Brachionus plicatilis]
MEFRQDMTNVSKYKIESLKPSLTDKMLNESSFRKKWSNYFFTILIFYQLKHVCRKTDECGLSRLCFLNPICAKKA